MTPFGRRAARRGRDGAKPSAGHSLLRDGDMPNPRRGGVGQPRTLQAPSRSGKGPFDEKVPVRRHCLG